MSNLLEGKSYVHGVESFMYDREPKFPYRNVLNAGRIGYTTKGLRWPENRRCEVIRVSESSAIVTFGMEINVPATITLEIPDARIRSIGCLVVGRGQTSLALRFLRILSEKELVAVTNNSTMRPGRPVEIPRMAPC